MIQLRHLIFNSDHRIIVHHRFSRNILMGLLQRLYLQGLKCLLYLIDRLSIWIKRFHLVLWTNERINLDYIILSTVWVDCSIKSLFNITFWVHHVLLSHSSHPIEISCISFLKFSFSNQVIKLILTELALVLGVRVKMLILVHSNVEKILLLNFQRVFLWGIWWIYLELIVYNKILILRLSIICIILLNLIWCPKSSFLIQRIQIIFFTASRIINIHLYLKISFINHFI